jgi:hypothetical protein
MKKSELVSLIAALIGVVIIVGLLAVLALREV